MLGVTGGEPQVRVGVSFGHEQMADPKGPAKHTLVSEQRD